MMGEDEDCGPTIERTARMLAAAAGQVWERLSHHPGFYRNYWREEAARVLGLPDPFASSSLPTATRHSAALPA